MRSASAICVSALAIGAIAFIAACSTSDAPSSPVIDSGIDAEIDPDGGPCTTADDCPVAGGNGYLCLFDIASGCSAKSWCVPRVVLPPGAGNCATTVLCACDGGGVTNGPGCGRPSGYAIAPVTSDKSCLDSPTDAGDAAAVDADANR